MTELQESVFGLAMAVWFGLMAMAAIVHGAHALDLYLKFRRELKNGEIQGNQIQLRKDYLIRQWRNEADERLMVMGLVLVGLLAARVALEFL